MLGIRSVATTTVREVPQSTSFYTVLQYNYVGHTLHNTCAGLLLGGPGEMMLLFLDASTYTQNSGRMWRLYVSAALHRGKKIGIVTELSINRSNHHHINDHNHSYNHNQKHNRKNEDDRNKLHEHNLTRDHGDDLYHLRKHDHKHVTIACAVHRSSGFSKEFYAKTF